MTLGSISRWQPKTRIGEIDVAKLSGFVDLIAAKADVGGCGDVVFVNTTFPPAFSHLAARLRRIIAVGHARLGGCLDFGCMGMQPVRSGDQIVKNAIGVVQPMAAKNPDRRNRRRGSDWHSRSGRVAGQGWLPWPENSCRRQEFSAARLPLRPMPAPHHTHPPVAAQYDAQVQAGSCVVTHNGALVLADVQPRRCSGPEDPPPSCGPRCHSKKPCRCEPRSRSERGSSKDSDQAAGIPEPIPRVENPGRAPAWHRRAARLGAGPAWPWHRRGSSTPVRPRFAAS